MESFDKICNEFGSKIDSEVQVKTFVIFGANGNWIVDKVFRDIGWKPMTDKYSKNFHLKWVESRLSINYENFKEGEQLVNRIPNCYMLTNKLGLLVNLHRFHLRCISEDIPGVPKLKLSEFLPETYRIDDQKDREFFAHRFKSGEVWISKPIGLNQGRGIYLVRDASQYTSPEVDKESKGSRLIQKYIGNPLLIDGRKFDIRVYMLVSSTKPFLVLFRNGYVRLSLQKYEQTADDISVHLTNQFIQRRCPLYDACKNETILSFERFNEYINKYVEPYKNIEHDWVLKSLTNQMKNISLFSFMAVKDKLKTKMGFFDLYGIDFLIDENMKVWLLEVNVNPCLATNCDHLKLLIPNIIKETIKVSLECFKKSWEKLPLLPCSSIHNFQILYYDCISGFEYSKNPLSYGIGLEGMSSASGVNEAIPVSPKMNIISVVFENSEDGEKPLKQSKKSMFEVNAQNPHYNGSDYSIKRVSTEEILAPMSYNLFENKDTNLKNTAFRLQAYNKETINITQPTNDVSSRFLIKNETDKNDTKLTHVLLTLPQAKKSLKKKNTEPTVPVLRTPVKSKSSPKFAFFTSGDARAGPLATSSSQELTEDFISNKMKKYRKYSTTQNNKLQQSIAQALTQQQQPYFEDRQGKIRTVQPSVSNSTQLPANIRALLRNNQVDAPHAMSTMKILKTLRPPGTSSIKPDYIATNKLLLQTMSKMNAERKIKNLQDTFYNQSISQFNF